MNSGTSRRAILYTLRELGRRAGAAEDWIERWRVSFGDTNVTLFPQPDSDARVVFPVDVTKPARLDALRSAPASRYQWMSSPGAVLSEQIPDFIVLFEDNPQPDGPLFETGDNQFVECRADIITSALWTLSRAEEEDTSLTDAHGRFPATASAAFRAECIDRPIVDEYGVAFEQALSRLFPAWKPQTRPLRYKLSHDVDLVGFPRSLRSTVGHIYPRRIVHAFIKDVLSAAGAGLPAYLASVLQTARISQERGLRSAFYWQACTPNKWDSGYDPAQPKIRSVIETLDERGFELGIHPGYFTFDSPQRLQEEIQRLRVVLGERPMGGRQHYLRWRPHTWRDWEDAGLAYDSTVGFAEEIGFRAGTAFPYHPWLRGEDRESQLLEVPLIVMDITLTRYMGLSSEETLSRVAALLKRCKAVGGVFALLWHNDNLIVPPLAALYRPVLDLIKDAEFYDWTVDRNPLALPSDTGQTTAV